METPQVGGGCRSRGGWGPLHGPRELVRAGAAAATSIPTAPAVALLLLAGASAVTGAPWLIVTAIAAFAATASLPDGGVTGAVAGVLLLIAAGVRAGDHRADAAVACGVVALACGLGSVLGRIRPSRRTTAPRAHASFVVAAQRHPWTTTAVVVIVGAVDAIWAIRCSEMHLRFLWALAPSAAGALTVHLVAGSRDLLGRLAPAAFGVPLAIVCGSVAFPRFGAGAILRLDVLGVLAVPAAWMVGWSYALGRRCATATPARAGTWIWVAAGLALRAGWIPDGSSRVDGTLLLASIAALPFLLAATAARVTRATRAAAWTAALFAGAAVVPMAVEIWGPSDPAWGATLVLDPIGPTVFQGLTAPELVEAVLTFLLRHVELAALFVGAAALARRGRSLTAIPDDHPVFTEGPWVPLPWRTGAVSAAAAARR